MILKVIDNEYGRLSTTDRQTDVPTDRQ